MQPRTPTGEEHSEAVRSPDHKCDGPSLISAPNTPGLLVSVRNAEEALQAAASTYVDIVDVKEPSLGSLGAVAAEVASEISQAILGSDHSSSTKLSIALGEVTDESGWSQLDSPTRNNALRGFQIAKVGLAGLRDRANWCELWEDYLQLLPQSMARVAVAYVDEAKANSPSLEDILTAGARLGCTFLLLDTFEKTNGGLFDLRSPAEIQSVIERAGRAGLKVVLAGSLSLSSVGQAIELQPAYVAVRGAVCDENRESPISNSALNRFTLAFQEMSTARKL